jgi:hypothetical protein
VSEHEDESRWDLCFHATCSREKGGEVRASFEKGAPLMNKDGRSYWGNHGSPRQAGSVRAA